jgi:hypothetical protein
VQVQVQLLPPSEDEQFVQPQLLPHLQHVPFVQVQVQLLPPSDDEQFVQLQSPWPPMEHNIINIIVPFYCTIYGINVRCSYLF